MSHGHEDHHDSDSHGHGHGHGHHVARKWYENEEGIVYHPAELAAYRINGRKAGKCVNLYIPLKDCLRTVSKLDQAFDPSIAYSNNSHVLNAFYNAPKKASSEGLSNTLSADKIEVTSVKVDLTVLLRIIKHAKEANFKLATGQLHGVFAEKNVEITNCYAVPNKDDDAAEDDFDNSMTARLEEVNMDNNKVGWYQISYANDHLSGESVATTFDYQNSVPYAVYLVYDILEVERGLRSPFKAYRINNKYMDLMKGDKVTYHQMKNLNFKVDKIYQEVPLEIVKTPLQLAYLHEQKRGLKNKFSSTKGTLDLIAYFERTISFLVESLEDQAALDLKMQHDHFAGLKNETKETRIKNLEIPTGDFVETFVSKQRINNFLSKINNCGKFQLETSFLLSENNK